MLAPHPTPWRRDLAALLRLAGPVAAARLGVMAMGLTDAVVVGRYSAQQLSFHALGWVLPGTVVVGAMGFLQGVPVMTARYLGQGRGELTGEVLRRGLRYALGLGLAIIAGLWFTGPVILQAFHLAPSLAEGAAWPLRIFTLSLPAALVGTCAALYLEAIGKPGVSMATMWMANGVNLAVDLVLVPGGLGLPAMGAVGAAWSTFTARGVLAIGLLIYLFRMREAAGLGLLQPVHDAPHAAVEQRRLGYAAGTSNLVEAGAFSGMTVVAGWVGALTVAGWAVVVNFASLVFMVPLGLSTAASVLVGRAYGARDEQGVTRAAVLAFAVAAAYGLMVGAAALFLRVHIAAGYTADPALIAAAAAGLVLTAVMYAPDAVQVVAAQALRARADVLMPTVTHVTSYAVVMLPLGWLLGVKLGHGLAGIIAACVIATFLSAALLVGRFWLLHRREQAA